MQIGNRKQFLEEAIKKAETGSFGQPIAGFSNNLARGAQDESDPADVAGALVVLRQYMDLLEKEELKPVAEALRVIQEKVEVLEGSRARKALGKRAVRVDHLAPLEQISQYRINSKRITDAPTADDFNALRNDLRTVLSVLGEVGALVSRSKVR